MCQNVNKCLYIHHLQSTPLYTKILTWVCVYQLKYKHVCVRVCVCVRVLYQLNDWDAYRRMLLGALSPIFPRFISCRHDFTFIETKKSFFTRHRKHPSLIIQWTSFLNEHLDLSPKITCFTGGTIEFINLYVLMCWWLIFNIFSLLKYPFLVL